MGIEKVSSVESTNVLLPTTASNAQTSWVDFSLVDRLLIRLDPNKEIPAGTYEFRFPITVPEQIPAYNVWLVTFCRHSSDSDCLGRSDSVVTFPLAGFRIGEVLPGGKGSVGSAAPYSMNCPVLSTAAAALFLGAFGERLEALW